MDPDKLVKIYDDDCYPSERYTVVFPVERHPRRDYWPFLSMGQYATYYRGEIYNRPGPWLGKRIKFADLPPDCQLLVLNDLSEIAK